VCGSLLQLSERRPAPSSGQARPWVTAAHSIRVSAPRPGISLTWLPAMRRETGGHRPRTRHVPRRGAHILSEPRPQLRHGARPSARHALPLGDGARVRDGRIHAARKHDVREPHALVLVGKPARKVTGRPVHEDCVAAAKLFRLPRAPVNIIVQAVVVRDLPAGYPGERARQWAVGYGCGDRQVAASLAPARRGQRNSPPRVAGEEWPPSLARLACECRKQADEPMSKRDDECSCSTLATRTLHGGAS